MLNYLILNFFSININMLTDAQSKSKEIFDQEAFV